MKGEIEMESKLGKGTLFKIKIPCELDSNQENESPSSEKIGIKDEINFKIKAILVAVKGDVDE